MKSGGGCVFVLFCFFLGVTKRWHLIICLCFLLNRIEWVPEHFLCEGLGIVKSIQSRWSAGGRSAKWRRPCVDVYKMLNLNTLRCRPSTPSRTEAQGTSGDGLDTDLTGPAGPSFLSRRRPSVSGGRFSAEVVLFFVSFYRSSARHLDTNIREAQKQRG